MKQNIVENMHKALRSLSIKTERIIIRPIEETDFEDICQYGCDEETGQYMIHWPKTKAQIKTFINDSTASMISECPAKYEFVMQLKSTSKIIGNITLEIKNLEAEIGWISNKKYWNKGYMSEAVNRVINFAFHDLSIGKITATCTDKNIPSYKVMEKCNMKRISEENNYKSIRQGVEVTYNKLTYCITCDSQIY
jgi:ribosomal-protein-alanine N-acetyltransferase